MSVNPAKVVQRARHDDSGAVAVIVAITSLLLFSIGALAVDLGNGYARKRASQTTADLAALAGAAQLGVAGGVTQARRVAVEYVADRNPTQSDDGVAVPACSVTSATAPVCWDNDGNLDNGEITFSDNAGVATRGIGATRIRVITPRRQVNFGLGSIMGISSVTVTKAATAGIFSPGGAATPPFYLTNTDKGLTCIKDDSPGGPGGPSPAVLRSALLAAPPGVPVPVLTGVTPPSPHVELSSFSITVAGTDLQGSTRVTFTGAAGTFIITATVSAAPNGKSVTATVPATLPAGTYALTVGSTASTSNPLPYTFSAAPPAPAAPTVTSLLPTSGPELAANPFTLVGTGLIAGTTVLFSGAGNATSVVISPTGTSLTGLTPAAVAGVYTVQVSNTNGLSSGGPTYTFTASPAPVIAIAPSAGPETATNTVRITGTNLPATVTTASVRFGGNPVQAATKNADGSITVTPPVGIAGNTVNVIVRNGSTNSNAVPYTYFPDPTACPGTSSNRGYLDEPRFSGNAQSLQLNIQQGIDHSMHTYQTYLLPADAPERSQPATGVECGALPAGTVLQSGSSAPIPNINCARLRTGNISGPLEDGFFDNGGSPQRGRMYHLEPGATTGVIGGHAGVDEDELFDSRFVDPVNLAAFQAAILAGIDPTPAQKGWLKAAVLRCPRFAILPVLNAPDDPPNGTTYYPIIGFKALFITSVVADTDADHGFSFQGGSLRTVKGFVFSLDWLDANLSSSSVEVTNEFIGTGPRIAKLIRDADDGAY